MDEHDMRVMFEHWVEAWNAEDDRRVESFYAEDAVFYQAPSKLVQAGRKYVTHAHRDLVSMSSDRQMSIRDLYVIGGTVIMEMTLTGTHDGPFFGWGATGRKFDIDSCLAFEVRDGQIVKQTTYLDTATLLRALGVVSINAGRAQAA